MRLPRLHQVLAILHISASCAMIGTAHAHGAYHDAVTQIQSALKQTPNDPALHFRLACAHHEHGEWEAALVETERVDRLEPGRYPTDLVRGQALAAGGHWSAAKTVFDRFLIGQPDHSVALAQRAKVLLKLEQTSAALADYRGAVAKGTPEADLFIEAADALATHGSLDEAVTLLRRAIAECGNVPSLLLRSLDHELAAKNFDEALARVAALQGGAPRPEPWLARRARILNQAGRVAEAKAAWTSLSDHLLALPNLDRGTPVMIELFSEAQHALGAPAPAPVIAPPALTPTPPTSLRP